MSRRTTTMLAWGAFALALVTNVAGMVLLAWVPTSALDRLNDSLLLSGAFVLVLLVFGVVGAVVAQRLPANPVGWLCLALAEMQGLTQVTYGAAHYSTAVSALPGEAWFAWFAGWSSVAPPAVLCVVCLVYPDGHLVSRGWRWAMGGTFAAIGFVVLQSLTRPGPLYDFPTVTNPTAVPALAALAEVPNEPLFLLAIAIGAASLLVRFRRARGLERAQLKWFAWSAGLMAAFLPLSFFLVPLLGLESGGTEDAVGGLVFAVLLCGLPISIGIAILRHRLYDIDRIINRTLVYAALTSILLLTYLTLVLGLRTLLDPFTGSSDLVVAASTLAVAALFRPVRSRVQAGVDRRFYRSRYDATSTLGSFATRLRQEVDLDAVSTDLRAVVRDAVQPAHVSLWLRGAP